MKRGAATDRGTDAKMELFYRLYDIVQI